MTLPSATSAKREGDVTNTTFPDAAHRPSSRDLPSLDGLRAFSIGFVILGHAIQGRVSPLIDIVLSRLANFGVCVFFAISGYLITTLLWREADRRGDISLRRFYLRRTLRIFPPYYQYLAVIAIGFAFGGWKLSAETRWWPAMSYVTNLFGTHNWLMLHSWSLSLEEQFYLTWPLALTACIRRRGVNSGTELAYRAAFTALVMLPVVRVVVFGITRDGTLTGGLIFDYVAAGSAISLYASTARNQRSWKVLSSTLDSPATPLCAALALALHLAFAGTIRWKFAIDTVIVTPIEAILLAIFVAWAVRNPRHPVGRVLNLQPLRIVGVGSYSLYLWQQLFFGQDIPFAREWALPMKLAGAGACAAASYWMVERPSLHLRARLERKYFPLR